jgi:plastocyanin
MRRMHWIAALLAITTTAACGDRLDSEPDAADMQPSLTPGGGDLPPVGVGPEVDATAVDVTLAEWSITMSHDSVPAGTVTFSIHNAGSMPHAFRIHGGDEDWSTDPMDPGEHVTMSVVLTPGTYDVHCPLGQGGDSHTQQGMQRRLRVY